MNKKKTKEVLMKYFYKDIMGYHPMFNSDCNAWSEMFQELFEEE